MDDDDEFGDLYADVLRPVPSSSPQPPSLPSPPKPQASAPSARAREEDWILGPAPIPEDPRLDWNDDDDDRPAATDPPRGPDAATIRPPDEGKVDGEHGIGEFDIEMDIPGLGGAGAVHGGDFLGGDARGPGSEDWDSDSDDDLRIVLNDDSMMGGRAGRGLSEEDEDGEDDLVIVADDGQHHQYQGMDDQDWGEDALQVGPDGEKKEADGAAKGLPGAGVAAGQRAGYGHAYHPQHHSQFKYVRPGAVDVPGGAAAGHGGVPGQLRPPLITSLAAGRGRGAPRSFHSGYSIPTWANNNLTRPFGIGLDFTLPSHKTIFEISIDVFEEKPWRLQGIDITDFFNFGLDEVSWKAYYKQLEQFRLESTMQSKIRVYESGRSDRDYDPDLPPELAAASGIQDISAEVAISGKLDSGQLDAFSQGMGSTQRQFQLPTGRAIQVESGYGERLPSMDTRPPRTRDIEAIIEIVCQDFVEDSDKSHIGLKPGVDPIADSSNGCYQIEEINRPDDLKLNGHLSRSQNRRGGAICGEGSTVALDHINETKDHNILEFPKRASSQDHHRSHTEIKSRAAGNSEEPQNERQNVEKFDKMIDNDSEPDNGLELSLSNEVKNTKELSLELRDEDHDDRLTLLDSADGEADDLPSDVHLSADSQNDDMSYSAKRQKLNSQIENPALLNNGDAEATFSDHSKEKSWSSMDNMKLAEGGDTEVVQAAGSRNSDDLGRDHSECVATNPQRDDYVQESQHESIKSEIPSRGREDSHCSRQQRNPDSNSVEYECTEDLERVKERGSSGAWNRRDNGSSDLGRREKDAKRRHNDDTRFRDRTRPLINDRKGRDADPHLRKGTDSNDWRAHYNREGALRQRERNNSMLKPQEYPEDAHMNRKLDEEQRKRDAMPKESLYGSQTREDVSHRRGRNDNPENRNKDDLTRVGDRMGNSRSVKHKDDSSKPRERDDRQRLKVEGHTHAHRERGELRSGAKNSRIVEDKSYAATMKIRGDHKGSDNDPVPKERRNDQSRRGERSKGENHSQHKSREGTHAGLSHVSREERSSRHGRLNSQSAHPSDAFSSRHVHRDIDKENSRKSKNPVTDQNDLPPAKRKHEDITIQQVDKGSGTLASDSSVKEGESGTDNFHPKSNPRKKHEDSGDIHAKSKDETISDDENQHESRGRSKLERWTSHKERDYSINRAQSSSLRTEAANGNVVLCDELTMTEVDKNVEKNVNSKESTPSIAENSVKEHDRHLETFEKLKKRSERFNLPMPGEKEALANKRLENEISVANNESPADSEVKQERPTRKRRWVSG